MTDPPPAAGEDAYAKETDPSLPLLYPIPGNSINDAESDTAEQWGDHHKHTKEEGFGEKNITSFGGFTLLVNNITGPGMVSIPLLFQQAGWFSPILVCIFSMVLSNLSSTMLCEAMSRVPGNARFTDRIELTTAAKYYFNKTFFMITMILFVCSLQSVNIASIIVSSQTADLAILRAFKHTCGLEFYPRFGWLCKERGSLGDSPFGNDYIISFGFLVVLVVSLPMGYFNLEDNVIIQKVAWASLLVILGIWYSFLAWNGLLFSRIPFWGSDQSQVIGTILFNYAFTVSVPSWVNEKQPQVSINKSIWLASLSATFVFITLGLVGAWAFELRDNEDILSALNDSIFKHNHAIRIVIQITVYLFPLVALISSIPVFSIIVRYNLIENQICKKFWATFWSVIFPWLVALPFYTGDGLQLVINWTSLVVTGIINFLIPFALYLLSRYRSRKNHQNVDNIFVSVPEYLRPDIIAIVSFFTLLLAILLSIIINIISAEK